MSRFQIGVFLVGMGIGLALPSLPAPLNIINPYLWLIIIIVGMFLIIKGS